MYRSKYFGGYAPWRVVEYEPGIRKLLRICRGYHLIFLYRTEFRYTGISYTDIYDISGSQTDESIYHKSMEMVFRYDAYYDLVFCDLCEISISNIGRSGL